MAGPQTRSASQRAADEALPVKHYAYVVCGATDLDDRWMYRDELLTYWYLFSQGLPRERIRVLNARSLDAFITADRSDLKSASGEILWDALDTRFSEDVIDEESLRDEVVDILQCQSSLRFDVKPNDVLLIFLFGHGIKATGALVLGCELLSPRDFSDGLNILTKKCKVFVSIHSCYSRKMVPAVEKMSSKDIFVEATAHDEAFALSPSSSGECYGGIFTDEIMKELKMSLTVRVPQYASDLTTAVITASDEWQEPFCAYSSSLREKDISCFIPPPLGGQQPPVSRRPLKRTFTEMERPLSRRRKRASATHEAAVIGPAEYLKRAHYPFKLSLPSQPFTNPPQAIGRHPCSDDIGLWMPLNKGDQDRAAEIINARHLMILAWADLSMIMFRHGNLSMACLQAMFTDVRFLPKKDKGNCRDMLTLISEKLEEIVFNGRNYSLYVEYGLTIAKSMGLSFSMLEEAVAHQVSTLTMAAEGRGTSSVSVSGLGFSADARGPYF